MTIYIFDCSSITLLVLGYGIACQLAVKELLGMMTDKDNQIPDTVRETQQDIQHISARLQG